MYLAFDGKDKNAIHAKNAKKPFIPFSFGLNPVTSLHSFTLREATLKIQLNNTAWSFLPCKYNFHSSLIRIIAFFSRIFSVMLSLHQSLGTTYPRL